MDFDYHSISVEVLETLVFTSTYGIAYEKGLIYSRMPLQVPEEDVKTY